MRFKERWSCFDTDGPNTSSGLTPHRSVTPPSNRWNVRQKGTFVGDRTRGTKAKKEKTERARFELAVRALARTTV